MIEANQFVHKSLVIPSVTLAKQGQQHACTMYFAIVALL